MPRLALLIFIALIVAASRADDGIKCDPGGNQNEINSCAVEEYIKADAELNRIFKAVINKEKSDKLFISKLRIAQKAWIAFRDADLNAQFACINEDIRLCWGSMYVMLLHTRKTELTRERIKYFRQILDDGRG